MKNLIKNQQRTIIQEFVEEIKKARMEISNNEPIKFRDDKNNHKIRKAYKIPVDLLRFRKDNGRIASDVMTYEKEKGTLSESTDFGQAQIRKFLLKKDPDPTKELTNSIIKDGQEDLAIITADGFLINGNRRKMVLEQLYEKYRGDIKYKYMKVVILPGIDETEPPPSIEEIEQVENRYQFQKTGKAEYYNFDMALAVKRKIDLGMDLEEILLDDPNYEELKGKALQNKIKEFKEEYIEPLKCVDRYLVYLKRPGHYNTISEGRGDSEGRWQAFLDYYNIVYKKIKDDKYRIKFGIRDGDEGKIENIAFKIIRKRLIKGVDKKAHQIMRDFPKLITNQNSKRELFKIEKINFELSKEEITDQDGNEIDEKTKDTIWGIKNAKDIVWHVKGAYEIMEHKKGQDTPIELLKTSLEKLFHSNLDVDNIDFGRIDEAMKITREIQNRANEIEHLLYESKKLKDKLKKKIKL
ncbi:MAG: hypothetical protein PHN88_08125 [Ignavibacteria bacterium]|nr:hypothetical protein [Ignavibacteria bacterium]